MSVLVEHLIRYRFAVAQVRCPNCVYFDLGCGNGFGLGVLLNSTENVVYGFDSDSTAVDAAARYLGQSPRAQLRRLDLNAAESYTTIADLLHNYDRQRRTIVCFETIEHLENFSHLVAFLNGEILAGTDVFLSVPNDAFWGIQNPYHKTVFGEDSLQELLQLFEMPAKLHKQFAVQGSTILPATLEQVGEKHLIGNFFAGSSGQVRVPHVPSHFILQFGASTESAIPFPASFSFEDNSEKRRWEAQRESDLAFWREEARRLGAK